MTACQAVGFNIMSKEYQQLGLDLVLPETKVSAPEHHFYWEQDNVGYTPPLTKHVREQVTLDSSCSLHVREQPASTVAPEHPFTHWTEVYWVKRGSRKNEYYRYCWMSGRKIHHHHISGGNVLSQTAIARLTIIEGAIAEGKTPQEIKRLIIEFPKQ